MHGFPNSTRLIRSRFTPDTNTTVCLTLRDEAIIHEVFRCGLLSRDHLLALGFASSVSRLNRTLRRLFDAGMVRRVFPTIGAFGSPALYGVGKRAGDIISRRFNVDPDEISRISRSDASRQFVDHTLAVSDFRIQLLTAVKEQGWSLSWSGERQARHEWTEEKGSRMHTHVLKPDAFFRLATAFGTLSYLVEVDLGHVSHGQWQRTIQRYREHARQGLLKEAYGVEVCPVLTVTRGEQLRLRHLMEAVPRGEERFLFTTTSAIAKMGVFGPIWWHRGTDRPLPLLKSSHYERGDAQ